MAWVKIILAAPQRPQRTIINRTQAIIRHDSKKSGLIYFTSAGMKWLRERKIKLSAGDRVDIFFDVDTDRFALKKSPDGFRLGADRAGQLRVSSRVLGLFITGRAEYRLKVLAKYDVVLVPVS